MNRNSAIVRAAIVFGVDVVVGFIAVAWFQWGSWLDLFGFSSRHPESALVYFKGFVCAGSMLLAVVFVLLSGFLFWRIGASAGVDAAGVLRRMFYGDKRILCVKYAVCLLIILISPAFYFFMWRLDQPRVVRIVGGFAFTFVAFLVLVSILDWFLEHTPQQRQESPASGKSLDSPA